MTSPSARVAEVFSAPAEGLPENRRHERISQDLQVRLLDPRARVVEEAGVVADLSRRGLSLHSRKASLAVGESIHFRLTLSSGEALRGKARVRWRRSLGHTNMHGLEIEEMGLLDRERLKRHLAPRRFGWLQAADLLLQSAVIVLAMLVLKEASASRPSFQAALLDFLPFGLTGSGFVLSYLLTKL